MPLMQLSTLVLPAPLGPISANSSPISTASDTFSSTVSPPKRKVRPLISSSAIPPSAPPILLDVAIAPTLAAPGAKIEFLDIGMTAQSLRASVKNEVAVLHDIAIVRDLKRHCRALLDDQNGDAKLAPDFN